MFRTDSGDGGNHPQSAEQARQPLPNHSEDRSNSATGSAAVGQLDRGEVLRFLQLLGKDPAETWFRIIRHKKDGTRHPRGGADLHGLDLKALSRDNANGWSVYYVSGNASTATSVRKKDGKPTGAVWEGDITSCPAVFAEWDDKPIEWQLSAWRVLGLPEPTVMVLSGGKSVHCYWVLTTPIAPAQWRPLQSRLIDHCGSDKNCKDPCRVMRLPGFQYINKTTNKPTGQITEVVHESGKTYTVAELEAYLTLPPNNINRDADNIKTDPEVNHRDTENIKRINQSRNDLPPRPLDDIQAAAQFIPQRVVGGNTYDECWHALCGCAAALAAIGLPEEQALDLLATKWPSRADAEQALESATTRNAASFWAIAKKHGFDTSRKLKAIPGGSKPSPQPAPNQLPASFLELIERLPDGWVMTEHGLRKTTASVGEIAEMIEKNTGQLLRFNEMTMYVEVNTPKGWAVVFDADMDSAYVRLDQKGWKIGSESVIKAICHVARQRSIHPVRQYLLRIEQDASIAPYDLDQVGPDMFRAPLPLHAAMVRKWLIGAVNRALEPGCQMDYMLVLQSPEQGIYKSTAITELASQDWHTSTMPKENKDFLLNVQSTWIYEFAELESVTSKRQVGSLKNEITTRVDNFRVPYGRANFPRKRGSVFCGTANTDNFLRDDTGNRRFWVVPIEGKQKLDLKAIKKHRDSIWKAAVLAYRKKEKPMLSAEQEASSELQNAGFKEQHAWLEMLHAWMNGTPLARFKPEDPTPQPYFPGIEYAPQDIIYSAGLKRPDQINNHDATTLGPLLRSLGFDTKRVVVGASKVRRWVKEPDQAPDHPRTTRTTPDHPETAAGGPATQAAAQSISGDGPPGPPKKLNREKTDPEQVGTVGQQAHGEQKGGLLKKAGGPGGPTAETACDTNGSDRTTCSPDDRWSSGGPSPHPPAWLPHLLEIYAANPTAHPSTLVNMLSGQHGINTTVARVRALLEQNDRQQAA